MDMVSSGLSKLVVIGSCVEKLDSTTVAQTTGPQLLRNPNDSCNKSVEQSCHNAKVEAETWDYQNSKPRHVEVRFGSQSSIRAIHGGFSYSTSLHMLGDPQLT